MKSYSGDIYEKEVLLKAAYAFTDIAYIHLDYKNGYYQVELVGKTEDIPDLYEKFENELVCQETRRIVTNKTKDIREIIVARSLSSTMANITNEDELIDNTSSNDEEFCADEILQDWFGKKN